MKLIILIAAIYSSTICPAQIDISRPVFDTATANTSKSFPSQLSKSSSGKIKLDRMQKWRMSGNRYLTGSLMLLSGAAKGFNETLQFNWNGFHSVFPKANPRWFWPSQSFRNKYKDGDPSKGAKFPLSTSVLVMVTDQYHLNNFIHRASITAALVIKIGEGKKPFRHYVFDALYYTACYQLGFGGVYYPFKNRN
jgi:hypothetical protein